MRTAQNNKKLVLVHRLSKFNARKNFNVIVSQNYSQGVTLKKYTNTLQSFDIFYPVNSLGVVLI